MEEKVMKHMEEYHIIARVVLVVALAALLGGRASATGAAARVAPRSGHEQIIFNFLNGDGNDPLPLVRDAAGNLYGTTYSGGSGHAGNAFELSPEEGGGWSFTVLHTFGLTSGDGIYPSGPLLMDANGNLYGLTQGGGTGDTCQGMGCGLFSNSRRKLGVVHGRRIFYTPSRVEVLTG
jgi:hypothetical protein